MDIDKFLQDLERLIEEIEDKVEKIENNTYAGMKEVPLLMKKIEKILPDWFGFIEQTKIGNQQMILDILADVMTALEAKDGVLLADALFYGLRGLMTEYHQIIKEALDGE